MRITNDFNLSPTLYRALCGWGGPEQDRRLHMERRKLAVTKLFAPTQQLVLLDRHDKEVVTDASSRVWMLFGNALHFVLEQGVDWNALQEIKLAMRFGDWTVRGRFDLMESGGLSDYKITSIWAVILGGTEELERQLNVYRLMVTTKLRFHPEFLEGSYILRDWNKNEALRNKDYPRIPFVTKRVAMWPFQEIYEFVHHRLELLIDNYPRSPEALPPCSPEERWAKPDSWAVIKEGNKRATRVFSASKEAHDFAREVAPKAKKSHQVIFRPGIWGRCENGYCDASPWCCQLASYLKAKKKNPEPIEATYRPPKQKAAKK